MTPRTKGDGDVPISLRKLAEATGLTVQRAPEEDRFRILDANGNVVIDEIRGKQTFGADETMAFLQQKAAAQE